jgi:hypothetical protein
VIGEQKTPNAQLPTSNAELQTALLIAGQLFGLATRLDADALERFLDSKPKDFYHEATCRAAIAFRRSIDSALSASSAKSAVKESGGGK